MWIIDFPSQFTCPKMVLPPWSMLFRPSVITNNSYSLLSTYYVPGTMLSTLCRLSHLVWTPPSSHILLYDVTVSCTFPLCYLPGLKAPEGRYNIFSYMTPNSPACSPPNTFHAIQTELIIFTLMISYKSLTGALQVLSSPEYLCSFPLLRQNIKETCKFSLW